MTLRWSALGGLTTLAALAGLAEVYKRKGDAIARDMFRRATARDAMPRPSCPPSSVCSLSAG